MKGRCKEEENWERKTLIRGKREKESQRRNEGENLGWL
jgi:hypothetical protein